jgi:hypothetical protein
MPTHSYALGALQENLHYEVLTLTLHEESVSGSAIKKVVFNRSIKKGYIMMYALTEEKEVKVYEISFFGTANSSTRLVKRIPNVDDISEVSLYNQFSFTPKPYRETNNESELMF